MSGHQIVIEYLQILLSPQVIAGAILITFLIIFKSELISLINRIASIKWGSAELSAPQPSIDRDESSEEPVGESLSEESATMENDNVSEEDPTQLRQALQAERARAHLWEYRYLNYFLVLNTQRVLDWLASLSDPTTYPTYDALWQQFIPTAQQRRTIIHVLEEHNLIVIKENDLIEITPKGKEYVQWRGPLPNK